MAALLSARQFVWLEFAAPRVSLFVDQCVQRAAQTQKAGLALPLCPGQQSASARPYGGGQSPKKPVGECSHSVVHGPRKQLARCSLYCEDQTSAGTRAAPAQKISPGFRPLALAGWLRIRQDR